MAVTISCADCGRDLWLDELSAERVLPFTFSTAGPTPKLLFIADFIYITNRAGANHVAGYNMTIDDCNYISCNQRDAHITPDLCLPRSLLEHGVAVARPNLSIAIIREICYVDRSVPCISRHQI